MIHSEEEIIDHLQKKIQGLVNRKKIDPGFELFLSEKDLFSELIADTYEEKQQIRMIASSAIDGFNSTSYIKIGTDIDDYEMSKAKNYREQYIEPFSSYNNNYTEISRDGLAGDWLKDNIILSSGYRRNPDLPGPLMTLFLIGFCIVIALLDLGSNWYEVILKIFASLMALSFGLIIYSIITNIISRNNFYLKRLIHFLLFLIYPLIIYICIKIYFF